MTRDPEQDTADLRRHIRRLVESATAEQLGAMREAWTDAGADLFAGLPRRDLDCACCWGEGCPQCITGSVGDLVEDVLVLRPDVDRACDWGEGCPQCAPPPLVAAGLADAVGLSPGAPWWENHSSACGVEYRGCAPDCPKDQHEKAHHPPTDNERPVAYEPLVLTARAGAYEMPAEPTWPTIRDRLVPGQRVTIPARYCGDGCHGVRVGTVQCVGFGETAVEMPGCVPVWVPIGEVEAA